MYLSSSYDEKPATVCSLLTAKRKKEKEKESKTVKKAKTNLFTNQVENEQIFYEYKKLQNV